MATSLILSILVTDFISDGNHSLIFAGAGLNKPPVIGVFDVIKQSVISMQSLPLISLNTVTFSAITNTVLVSGIDSNQKLAVVNVYLNQSIPGGFIYDLSPNSIAPVYATAMADPSSSGMMLLGRVSSSLENIVMVFNSEAVAQGSAIVSLNNYLLQANAVAALYNNAMAFVGKAALLKDPKLFYAIIVNKLSVYHIETTAGYICTQESYTTDVVVDPQNPAHRIIAVGSIAGFEPNVTEYNSVLLVSMTDFIVSAFRIRLQPGDTVSNCLISILGTGFLAQCWVKSTLHPPENIFFLLSSSLTTDDLSVEYEIMEDVFFVSKYFDVSPQDLQVLSSANSHVPSGKPSLMPSVLPSAVPSLSPQIWRKPANV